MPENLPDSRDRGESARLARRARRREKSREEILDAARQVLLRSGVAAMTLAAVAEEVGVSKAALYYYFPSKDALVFELVFAQFKTHAEAVHDAVEKTTDGVGALNALIGESVRTFALRLEDFRLAFLQTQLASQGSVQFDQQQFARIRPLNDLILASVAAKVDRDQSESGRHSRVEPRLLAFLAYLAAIGVLTMKGLVESLNDPLKYSDEEMIEALAKVFAAAARSP